MKKRALVTGGAGFIGSHLCEYLLKKDYHVVAIDNLLTGSIANLKTCQKHVHFQFVRASITDTPVLDRFISESDIVFHLAAVVGVQLIVDKTVLTIETNIMGTESVLRSALRYGRKVLVASTSEVYGKGNKIPFAEDDDVLLGATLKSRWSYAASKMVDEFLALAYHHEYQLPVVPFRLFNTVGPRQSGQYGMVIPRFVSQALQHKPVLVHGDGTQSRCFCHVSDVVQAIYLLSEQQSAIGRVFNIGGTEEISIFKLAETIIKQTNSKSKIEYVPYDQVYGKGFEDMQRRVPDIQRIQNLTKWTPQLSLQDIIQDVSEYSLGQHQ